MSSGDGRREGSGQEPEQLALVREAVRERKPPRARPRTWRGAELAAELPVARVLVDKGLVHLDRLFDYAVPAAMDEEAQPGVRVRVRFGAGAHRVREGRLPACLEACPTGARVFGNVLDPKSEIRWVLDHKRVFVLKEELGTRPRFFYFFDK